MQILKQALMTVLRDQKTPMHIFRATAEQLSLILAAETSEFVGAAACDVTTPLKITASGVCMHEDIVLIPILRSGLALLPAFLQTYPHARVGCIGLKRDEKTAIAHLYYKNMPTISSRDRVILLDPMIATGGSGAAALEIVTQMGVKQEQIAFVGVIGSDAGVAYIKERYPRIQLTVAECDHELNAAKYIMPGLGDFGDRFFGTL